MKPKSRYEWKNSEKERERVLVVLADELDYLYTKNQQVIYKLFDWPNEPNSQLIVIVVIDFIDYL